MPYRNRTRLPRESRYAELLEYTIQAISEFGIMRAGHGDVAKLAGVSTATVFNYFPTREALIDAAIDDLDEFVDGVFDGRDLNSPKHPILALVSVLRERIVSDVFRIKAFLNLSVVFSPELRCRYTEIENKIIDRLSTEILTNSDEPDCDSRIVYSAGKGFVLMILDGAPAEQTQLYAVRTVEALQRLNILSVIPNLNKCQHTPEALSDKYGSADNGDVENNRRRKTS